jgi:hypothetical protein
VLLAGACLGWQLLRQNGRMLLRVEGLEKRLNELEFAGPSEPAGLPLDSMAPDFDLPDLAGERKTLAQCPGQTVLLIFYDPACSNPCLRFSDFSGSNGCQAMSETTTEEKTKESHEQQIR